jgi:primosomal protein N' (replication factor Y)
MTALFARVVLPIPLDRAFDYAVPHPISEKVKPGARLLVPFRNAEKAAYCISIPDKPEVENPKSVISVIDDEPLLDEHMLALTRWMADYYHASHGEVLDAVLPSAVKKPRRPRTLLFASLAVPPEELDARISSLKRKPSAPQLKLLEILREKAASGIAEVCVPLLRELAGTSPGPMKALIKSGFLRIEARPLISEEFCLYTAPEPPESSIKLTSQQEAALREVVEAIDSGQYRTVLLHGVTGSGKTEVYLRSLSKVVAKGLQGIVLVPEISLTPQTLSRFSSRFSRVAILHSAMSDRERRDSWRKIASGEADVVVGPRSAVFAPARKLGLIVVDEEHESSFKQENAPRYNGRDVAVMRARMLGIPVILGSATPDLVTYANAASGKYRLVWMSKRVTKYDLPPVRILDLANECAEQRKKVMFARELAAAVTETLKRREQAILLLNRRGFHTQASCPMCGHVETCKYCAVAMTLHSGRGKMVCHYCGDEHPAPKICPACNLREISYFGAGTERVVEELLKFAPGARIVRMDSDTMKTRSDYEKALITFARGDADVLVGTQMIAKGLDFPRVTLVGALSADGAFSLPDYRVAERTFQLLVQVAGRAGRGDARGRVYFQAFQTNHYAITSAAKHDYREFAARELAFRREWRYPPYCRIARIVVQGPQPDKVHKEAAAIKEALSKSAALFAGAEILGPARCPIPMLKGSHRVHVLIKAAGSGDLKEMLKALRRPKSPKSVLKIQVDVDPLTIL